MNPVGKALWFIEAHFASEIQLDDVATVAGVSRYHLTRAFGDTMGYSVMRYVRGRRLTEAARALARGGPDILAAALEAGYGSHEAFTRAFHEQFGFTPEAIRDQGHLLNISVMEPIKMEENLRTGAPPVRFETARFFSLPASPAATHVIRAPEFHPSGNALCFTLETFRVKSAKQPSVSDTTAMTKAILIICAVSKYRIFPEFPQI